MVTQLINKEEDKESKEPVELYPEEEAKTFDNVVKQENIIYRPSILSAIIKGGKAIFGSGNKCFKFNENNGLWLGHANYASAPFRVSMAGKLTADTLNMGDEVRIVSTAAGIQTAIDAVSAGGGGTVQLKDGTYVLTSDITMKEGVKLIGINPTDTILYFSGNYGVKIVGSNAYSTGTVSINKGSTTVTGSGTSWEANVSVGYKIRLSGFWYKVSAVGSNTSITISSKYGQGTLSGATYLSANTIDRIDIKEMTITNSGISALTIQYATHINASDLYVVNSNKGLEIDDVGHSTFEQIVMLNNTSHGFDIANLSYTNFLTGYASNNGGDGINISGSNSKEISFINIITEGNTGNGFYIADATAIIYLAGSISQNGDDGIELNANTTDVNILNSKIENNGAYGANIAAATCVRTVIGGNILNGNTSGAVDDNGTNTVIRGNIGVDDNGTGSSSNIVYYANDTLRNSNNDQQTTTSTSYIKVKEVKLNADLSACRIKFDLNVTEGVHDCWAEIWKNGAKIGTTRNITSGWETFSEDFADFVKDDLIQIYAKVVHSDYTAYVKNMRFYYSRQITTINGETLTTPLEIDTSAISMTNQDP